MLDVRSVGADLSPEELDATMGDVTYFLDEYGSTSAVRQKLHEQWSDICQLKSTVKKRLGSAATPVEQDNQEDISADAIAGSGERPHDDVDCIMIDVQYFLDKFGSTKAVRQRLEKQRKEIVGLQRTVRFLEEHVRKRRKERDEKDVSVRTKGDAQEVVDLLVESVGGAETPFRPNFDEFTAGNHSKHHIYGNDQHGDAMRPLQINSNFPEAKNAVYTAYKSKPKVCSYLYCTNQPQYQGLCNHHGGYRLCKIEGCNQREKSSRLCAHHAAEYEVKATNTSIKPKLDDHKTIHQIGGESGDQDKSREFLVCKVDGCGRYGFRGLCHVHRSNSQSHSRSSSVESTTSSKSKGTHKAIGHTVCLYPTCRKWGMRHDGNRLYCADHQAGSCETSSDAPKPRKTCLVGGCKKGVVREGLLPLNCADHQNWTGAQSSQASVPRFRKSHKTCRVSGCMKWVRDESIYRYLGYCVDHRAEFGPENRNKDGNSTSTGESGISESLAKSEKTGLRTQRPASKPKPVLCKFPGCVKRSQHGGQKPGNCFAHGGGIRCSVSDCPKKAQSKGLCASHGGWRKCKEEDCEKHRVAAGYCMLHYRARRANNTTSNALAS